MSAGQLATSPAEVWGAHLLKEQLPEMLLPMCCSFVGGERFQTCRDNQGFGAQKFEAFMGVEWGTLRKRRESFRNGVEGGYLKIKIPVRPYQWRKMGFMFAGQTNSRNERARGARLQLLPWHVSLLVPCRVHGRLVIYTAVLVYLEFSSNSRDLSCLCRLLRSRGPSVCCRDLWSRGGLRNQDPFFALSPLWLMPHPTRFVCTAYFPPRALLCNRLLLKPAFSQLVTPQRTAKEGLLCG